MDLRPLSLFIGVLASVFALFALLTSEEVCADSWALPVTDTTSSPNGKFRFTVEPAPIDSQLVYFIEESNAQSEGKPVYRPAPIGFLEKVGIDGNWQPVWVGPLLNSVAPVSILVADDGQHVVTFDNWHSVGHGENVIVVYGAAGEAIRSMPLTELLPQYYIDALPHTTSSLSWRKDSEILGPNTKLAIDVLVPGSGRGEEADSVRFLITLEKGEISYPEPADWALADCAAKKVNEERERADQERLAYLREPLSAPKDCDMGEWHGYLREAHLRLAPDWLGSSSTSTTVLFPANHPRHAESVEWLRDRMVESGGYERAESFVAPCSPGALVSAVSEIVDEIEADSLSEATFFVSTPYAYKGQLSRLIEPTGAKFIWLDPMAQIPQRPERIPGSVKKEAADAERLRNLSEEMDELMSDTEDDVF